MFSSLLISSPFSPQIFSYISSFTHHTIPFSSPHLPLLPPTSASSKHLTTLSFHITTPSSKLPFPHTQPISSSFLLTPLPTYNPLLPSHRPSPTFQPLPPMSLRPSFLLPPLPPSSSLFPLTTPPFPLSSPHLFFLLLLHIAQQYVIVFRN